MKTDAIQGSRAPSERTFPRLTPWVVVVFPLLVVGLFLVVQQTIEVNTFDFSEIRRAKPDAAFLGRFHAAKTNWASSIFLSLVLMAAIVTRGAMCVLRSAMGRNGKVAVLGLALSIPVVVSLCHGLVIAPMQSAELTLVNHVSSYCGRYVLLYFMAGLFASAFLFACGLACVLCDALDPTASIATVTVARGIVREVLGLVAVWLAVGVVGIGLFHRMTMACLHPKDAQIFSAVAQSSSIFAGAFYTALIAAMFLPAEILLRSAALARAPVANGEGGTSQAWLTENGFDVSVIKSLAEVTAMFAPLFASVVQGLIELP